MKKKKILSVFLVLALISALFAGCGASTDAKNSAAMDMPRAEASPMEMEMARGALESANEASAMALPESRKWIVTVRISSETEDLDAATQALNQRIEAMAGYVEDQRVHNGSAYRGSRYRSASMTIRIPADRVEEFTEEVAGIANVVSKEKNLEDVTLRYVATESRMKALQAEEARLLELLAQAENMTDLLEIEGRLTDVRYELESVTSQKRLFDNKIDYATIHLDLEEVQEYTPVEEVTVWQRISAGFVSSLKGLGRGAVDMLVWLIAYSPYLVVFALLAGIVTLLVKRGRKKKKDQA